MKRYFKHFKIMLSCFMIFYIVLNSACTKTNMSINNNVVNPKYKSSISYRNPNNPYDTAGAMHNNALDYIIHHYVEPYNQTDSLKLSYALAWSYANNIKFDNSNDSLNLSESLLSTINNSWQDIRDSAINNGYSNNCILYIDSIETILSVDTTNINSTVQIETFLNQYIQGKVDEFKLMEGSISSNISDSTEMRILFVSCSIARFSLYYWTNQVMNCPDIWGGPSICMLGKNNQTTLLYLDFIRWIIGGGAKKDAKGALVSGGSAFGYVWFTGGSVSFAGVCGAALIGGILSSI